MPSVTRSDRSSRRDRREAMERRVLAATEQLIQEGAGFTELSVEKLAAVAGISRSTFYVHFEDKSDLARRMTKTVLAELETVSREWWSTADSADREHLQTALTSIIDVYRRRGAAFTMVVEAAAYDASVAEEVRSQMQSIIEATRKAIELGQAAGVMRAVEPAETAAVLTWMVERAGYQLVRMSDPDGDAKIVSVLTDVIFSTLYRLDSD
ncbi:AcrR family transcriptional regulator [Kibdelosporangium banguiense]|uniref:AcrR family transcriptional regulator n=1 Tax=Kibdelosporangium banguiense TaxID=1365924 RepID=A0ABS4TJB3_9PSEU|nr:TetR/AcrR family transcriptional regulator [Kibdelosporangium banguiense]MBP2324495.1 AcrR family transcriptional regulator [Kibdelosporangium banguiense]